MTYALLLAFFRNDMGFGGNNGLTDFKDILGFNVQAHGTRAALFALAPRAGARLLICRDRQFEARQGAGRGARRRKPHALPRLPVENYKLFVFVVGHDGRRRRRALRAAGRHHQSRRIRAGQFDRGRHLGRRRRARHADRRRSSAPSSSTSARPGSPAPARILAVRARRRCSSWSRCSCRRASSAPGAVRGNRATDQPPRERRAEPAMTPPAGGVSPEPAE
jgi:hypothetical protein